jgi:hypothetical protein
MFVLLTRVQNILCSYNNAKKKTLLPFNSTTKQFCIADSDASRNNTKEGIVSFKW